MTNRSHIDLLNFLCFLPCLFNKRLVDSNPCRGDEAVNLAKVFDDFIEGRRQVFFA